MMIANFFQKTKPIHAILISGLFFIYFLLAIFLVEKPEYSHLTFFHKLSLLLGFLILFFLVRFINRKNYLSALNSYVLLVLALLYGVFPQTMQFSNLWIVHFILLLAFRRIYSIRTFKSIQQKLFDSGFWIGIASLINFWSSIFLVLIYVAIISHKKQSIRNFIIPIIGFLTPIFLGFTYFYVTDTDAFFYKKLIFNYSLTFDSYTAITLLLPISILFLIGILAISVVSLKINSLSNDLKQSWAIVIFHFFCAVYIILFSPIKDGSEMVFIFFPLTIIITNFLQTFQKKYLKEIVVFGLLVLSISVYFL